MITKLEIATKAFTNANTPANHLYLIFFIPIFWIKSTSIQIIKTTTTTSFHNANQFGKLRTLTKKTTDMFWIGNAAANIKSKLPIVFGTKLTLEDIRVIFNSEAVLGFTNNKVADPNIKILIKIDRFFD